MDKLHIHIRITVRPPKEGNKIGENGKKKRANVVPCRRLLKNRSRESEFMSANKISNLPLLKTYGWEGNRENMKAI
jgi:hypothetical protein